MNRKQRHDMVIAASVLAGIVLVMVLIAQFA